MFTRICRWYRRWVYRPGRVVSRFLAKDVRRDVLVVDTSEIDSDQITVRVRTWNVLHTVRGLSPLPPFGEARTVAISDLWTWSGQSWGGPVPEEEG